MDINMKWLELIHSVSSTWACSIQAEYRFFIVMEMLIATAVQCLKCRRCPICQWCKSYLRQLSQSNRDFGLFYPVFDCSGWQAKQQKNPGAVVACIKQLDCMTGSGINSIFWQRGHRVHRWYGFRSWFDIAGRGSIYLCGTALKAALEAAPFMQQWLSITATIRLVQRYCF